MGDTVSDPADKRTPSDLRIPDESERGIFAAVEPWVVEAVGPAPAILYASFRFRRRLAPDEPVILGDGDWQAWTGLSRTQVSRAKQRLIDAGLVEVDVRKKRGVPMSHWRLGRAVHRAVSREPGPRDTARSSTPEEVEEEDPLAGTPTARLPLDDVPAVDPEPAPAKDPIKERAREIVTKVWERSDPKPATPFVGVVKIAERLLRAGHDPQAIGRAMLAVPTISTGWVEAEIRKSSGTPPSRRAPIDTDRDAPEGRIDL